MSSKLPKMLRIRQNYPCSEEITNLQSSILGAFYRIGFDGQIFNGKRVGIAVGSRGIRRETEIVKFLVEYIKSRGGNPEIFAAMGCHGGATAEGQREMLYSLGFIEEEMKCPVSTCAQSVCYGIADSGNEVIGNVLPFQYDAIVLVNRIKMHTDFSDVTESGLLKLCAIGIGNPAGCNNVHKNALRMGYGEAIREAGLYMLNKLPVVLGIAITENWKHKIDRIEAIYPENILEREKELLAAVKKDCIRLPVDKADALIVGEIGKNISGTGMDTKVIGRIRIIGQAEPEKPKIKRIGVLGLSSESHGNAIGIGLADFAPIKVLDDIDIRATSINGWSSMCPEQASLPCFLQNDREVFEQSIQTIGLDNCDNAHLIYIQDTNHITEMAVSESLYRDCLINNEYIERIGDPFELIFDEEGKLINRWKNGELITR